MTPLGNGAGAASGSWGSDSAGGWVSGTGGWVGRGTARARATESRADGTEFDVGVSDLGIAALGLDVGGCTGVGSTRATVDTRCGGASIGGVVGVEPEHLGGVVVPDGEGENHSPAERVTHSSHTAESLVVVDIVEDLLLLRAELVGDRVDGVNSGDGNLGVLDDLTVLDVETTDLGKRSVGGVVGGDELSNNGELLGGVDGHAGAEESLVSHTPGVEVTSGLVTKTSITVVTITTLNTRATGLTVGVADVGSEGSGVGVGFPDIHLTAAGSEGT